MGGPNPDRSAKRPEWRDHRTLRQLRDAGFTLRTWCSRCGAVTLVDFDHLMERRGEEGVPWDRFVRCDKLDCRGRAFFSASSNRHTWFRLTRDWS